jgi:hypothetical protein
MDVQDQNPDGRIDLWGASPVRGQPAGVSSIPRYFEAAYDVARRSDDAELRASIVASMGDYLGYWLSPLKRDPESGLVTAVFEETFGAVSMAPGALAPVDLNVAVALGCEYVAALHGAAGQPSLAKVYAAHFRALKSAINLHCWNERDGVYYNYNVGENAQTGRLIVSAFDPLRSGIAPAERVERLLDKLTDPALFNWGGHGLTSLAKTEPDYVEAVGPYDGRAWLGDVWTMRNLPVIAGLRDAGRHGLAAELAWSTVKTFHGTYTEYVHPTTGSGEGVQRYGWSASQYIQCVVEHLLGVDYDAIHGRLRLFPHIPEELYGETLKLEGLRLPPDGAARLSLEARRSTSAQMAVTARIEGPLPGVRLSVAVPGGPKDVQAYDGDGKALDLRPARGADNAAEVVLTLRREQTVRFGPAP